MLSYSHLTESIFPYLFSVDTLQCENFTEFNCGRRFEEKYQCKLLTFEVFIMAKSTVPIVVWVLCDGVSTFTSVCWRSHEIPYTMQWLLKSRVPNLNSYIWLFADHFHKKLKIYMKCVTFPFHQFFLTQTKEVRIYENILDTLVLILFMITFFWLLRPRKAILKVR